MLFRKKVDRSCAYCAHAGRISDEEMICRRRGVVPSGGQCRRFRYDPLKRVPARPRPKAESQYDPSDFQL